MMTDRKLLYALILAGMSLGTAWAIRGQFGHVQGAAWAGGIGALSIVLLSKRDDWYAKAFHLSLASAVGWGIGGIISYGAVVGYGRGTDFGNVYYGLVMLFVIGSLFGLVGGGLFGLMLSDSPEKPVKWPQLLVELTAGAIIFYFLLIEEFSWLMTPPRSEAWAACFGVVVALFWYLVRNREYAVIRLAIFAGLGGGFGFAFGNFLQVMGSISGINFNFWNVMEYSIGFFGGAGLAYGTFTSQWPVTGVKIHRTKVIAPIMILSFVIPFIVWEQSFGTERLLGIAKELRPFGNEMGLVRKAQWVSILLVVCFGMFSYHKYSKMYGLQNIQFPHSYIKSFFLGLFGLYVIFTLLVTMSFVSLYRIEQHLYMVNVAIVMLSITRLQPDFTERGLNFKRWLTNLLFVLAFLAILTAVAVSSHGELSGTQIRFN